MEQKKGSKKGGASASSKSAVTRPAKENVRAPPTPRNTAKSTTKTGRVQQEDRQADGRPKKKTEREGNKVDEEPSISTSRVLLPPRAARADATEKIREIYKGRRGN
jgi:hypothetical protein